MTAVVTEAERVGGSMQHLVGKLDPGNLADLLTGYELRVRELDDQLRKTEIPAEVLRRRVTWLRTTTCKLPPFITGALADEIEALLDALGVDQGVEPDYSAVRDAVGEEDYVGLLPAHVVEALGRDLAREQG